MDGDTDYGKGNARWFNKKIMTIQPIILIYVASENNLNLFFLFFPLKLRMLWAATLKML